MWNSCYDEGNSCLIYYNENCEEIDDTVKQIKIKLDTQKDQIFKLMEKLTKKPIFNKKFQIWYTTCKR